VNTHRSEASAMEAPPPASRGRVVLFWSAMLVGVVLAASTAVFAVLAQQGALARARTAEGVVGDVRVVGSALGHVQAGNSVDFDRLPTLLPRIQRGLSSLGTGGVSDYTPGQLLPRTATPGPWASFHARVVGWEKYLQSLRDSATVVRELAVAEKTFRDTLASLPESIKAIREQPAMAQPAWERALQPYFQGFDGTIDSVNTLFTPKRHLRAEQLRWADQTAASAVSFAQVLDVANKDANIPNQARTALATFANQMKILGETAHLLESRFDFRVALEASERDVSQEVMSVLPSLDAAREQAWKAVEWPAWTVWAALTGLCLFLVGVTGMARQAWMARRWQALLTQESRVGHALQEQVDGTVRKLKTILEGNWLDRLEERPDEQIFTLNTMINRILASKDSTFREVRTHLDHVLRSLDAIQSSVLKAVDESGIQISALTDTVRSRPETQLVWSQMGSQQNEMSTSADLLMDQGKLTSDRLKETSWRSGKVGRSTQDIIRRLKKLGEAVQAVGAQVDTMRDMGRKVQVVSTNVAVQAAGSGEAGRIFSVLARELQQLAHDAAEGAKVMDSRVSDILREAKETVAAMEQVGPDIDSLLSGQEEYATLFMDMNKHIENLWTTAHGLKKTSLDFSRRFVHQGGQIQAVLERSMGCDPIWRQAHESIDKIRSMVDDAHRVCKINSG
jgi:methyl-accepting chemotaxis protein